MKSAVAMARLGRASANPPPHPQPREAECEEESRGGFGDKRRRTHQKVARVGEYLAHLYPVTRIFVGDELRRN